MFVVDGAPPLLATTPPPPLGAAAGAASSGGAHSSHSPLGAVGHWGVKTASAGSEAEALAPGGLALATQSVIALTGGEERGRKVPSRQELQQNMHSHRHVQAWGGSESDREIPQA